MKKDNMVAEVVAQPPSKAHRGTLIQQLYQQALSVADEGKGIRYRFEDYRTQHSVVGGIQRAARLDGYRANTQSGVNHTSTIWIDKTPYPRGTTKG